jgi:hypothetical protein
MLIYWSLIITFPFDWRYLMFSRWIEIFSCVKLISFVQENINVAAIQPYIARSRNHQQTICIIDRKPLWRHRTIAGSIIIESTRPREKLYTSAQSKKKKVWLHSTRYQLFERAKNKLHNRSVTENNQIFDLLKTASYLTDTNEDFFFGNHGPSWPISSR